MSEEVWQEYRETGDLALRNRLVLTYVPLVKHIVYRKIRELPASCEVDDLISCGIETLIGAIDRYDPPRAPVWRRTSGRASTVPSSTSCAAATGRRAPSAVWGASSPGRVRRSWERTGVRPPAPSSPT
jgi:hypothetical protein